MKKTGAHIKPDCPFPSNEDCQNLSEHLQPWDGMLQDRAAMEHDNKDDADKVAAALKGVFTEMILLTDGDCQYIGIVALRIIGFTYQQIATINKKTRQAVEKFIAKYEDENPEMVDILRHFRGNDSYVIDEIMSRVKKRPKKQA